VVDLGLGFKQGTTMGLVPDRREDLVSPPAAYRTQIDCAAANRRGCTEGPPNDIILVVFCGANRHLQTPFRPHWSKASASYSMELSSGGWLLSGGGRHQPDYRD
jgi:hypothetical protein